MHLEYTSECLLQSRTDQETTTKANQIWYWNAEMLHDLQQTTTSMFITNS
jgi:hypothetical protein